MDRSQVKLKNRFLLPLNLTIGSKFVKKKTSPHEGLAQNKVPESINKFLDSEYLNEAIKKAHREYSVAVKSVLRPDNMNEAIEEESESDNDRNQEIEKMIRSNSMYGRTYYGENKELGSNAVVSEKLRLYKRTLKLRENQLTKAFKIIRKQQLSNMLNN